MQKNRFRITFAATDLSFIEIDSDRWARIARASIRAPIQVLVPRDEKIKCLVFSQDSEAP
jgi:hypothetical protein